MFDSDQKAIDPFFKRGQHKEIDDYSSSKSYFHLPRRTIRNYSNKIDITEQTLNDEKILNRNTVAFDTIYDDFNILCREAWKNTNLYYC